jgi:type I restriction enzyme, R subunit
VGKEKSSRAKASEMEHAVRWHIRQHLDEDPERYDRLSERLEQILAELQGRWDELMVALSEIIREARAGRQADDTGLDPETQAPFLGLLKQEVAGNGDLGRTQLERLAQVTIDLVDHIQQEIRLVGFWQNAHAQEVLHRWLVQFLDDQDLLPFDRLSHAADRLVELAKANHIRLTR